MRTVVRNSFARQSIRAERIPATGPMRSCAFCGSIRVTRGREWLYRFHVDDDQGARHSGTLAGGRLFCSRACAETYIGRPFDETR